MPSLWFCAISLVGLHLVPRVLVCVEPDAAAGLADRKDQRGVVSGRAERDRRRRIEQLRRGGAAQTAAVVCRTLVS